MKDPFVKPTEKLKKEVEEQRNSLAPDYKEFYEKNDLTVWKKYALTSRPERSCYMRLYALSKCESGEHFHITLMLFSHTGEQICLVGGIEIEDLVPYPYDETNPPPAEELEMEKVLVNRITGSISKAVSIITAGVFGDEERDSGNVTGTAKMKVKKRHDH